MLREGVDGVDTDKGPAGNCQLRPHLRVERKLNSSDEFAHWRFGDVGDRWVFKAKELDAGRKRGTEGFHAINLNSGPWWDHEPSPAVVDGDVGTRSLEKLLELVESTPVRRCRCSNWRLVASARPPRVTGRSSPATSCLTKAMRSAVSTTLWSLSLNA